MLPSPSSKIRWLRLLQIVLDAMLVGIAFLFSFFIRFDGHPGHYLHQFILLVAPITLAKLIVNWMFGVYRRLWRYTGLTEVIELGSSLLLFSTGLLTTAILPK